MFRKKASAALLLGTALLTTSALAQPKLSVSGFLDADVWTNFAGNFYTNNELDVGMTLEFSEKVSAHVYATTLYGAIPAGGGYASDSTSRWSGVAFDGFDITFASDVGTFAVGDLVYQYGKFNYYLYKRRSMITPETFIRGVSYSIGGDKIGQTVMMGVSDTDISTADIVGSTSISLGEGSDVGVYYGVRSSMMDGFEKSGKAFIGAQYTGSVGEVLAIKADVGLKVFGEKEKSIAVPLLIEPVLTLGSFTTALSVYYNIDPDSAVDYSKEGAPEQFFAYVEPGYAFNDMIAAGLPLEIHSLGKVSEMEDAGQFWAVPTLYVYPFEKVQWWIWGQVIAPFAKDKDLSYGLGSEIIVEF
jgi:hypothetical protein